jgi:hypothetical protein
LVENSLAVEGRELFVEVDCEEVQVPRSSFEDGLVVSEDIVEVIRSFCSNWSNLLVATCISWYKEYWDSLDLLGVSMAPRGDGQLPYLGVLVNRRFSV